MATVKIFINSYYKYYLLFIFLMWFMTFFISWDVEINGIVIYLFLTQKCFPILGIITVLLGLISKKISLVIFGMLFYFVFWINMLILFAIFPIFVGN